MGKLQDFVRECIVECKTRAEINTQSKAEVLLDRFAEHLDKNGDPGGGSAGIKRVESLDTSSPEKLVQLRDLETGVYMLYGYFSPYSGSDTSMLFNDTIVCISRKDAGTHLMCLTALNCKINFLEILADESAPGGHTYTRTDINLLDLHGLVARVEALEAAAANA